MFSRGSKSNLLNLKLICLIVTTSSVLLTNGNPASDGFHQIKGLFLTNITVPSVVDFRNSTILSCSYEMGNHKLNSVKWYKDGYEFFRYSPMMQPNILTFNVPGVTISNKKICNQFTCSIELHRLNPTSSGSYRCEVSGDAPEFELISQTGNMTVAALPRHEPVIYGLQSSYRFDDFIVANCTSDWSSPPAALSWYINGIRAPSDLLQQQRETTMPRDGFMLHLRSLEIRFHLDKTTIINTRGILEMKCLADIVTLPSKASHTIVQSYISSKDDLHNQKLVNWKNSAFHKTSNNVSTIFILFFAIIFQRYPESSINYFFTPELLR